MPPFIRIVALFCFLVSSLVANPFYGKVSGLLREQKYPELDALYEQVNKGPFVIYTNTGLTCFFEAMSPDSDAPEKQWQSRFDQIQAWRDHDPKSPAAALAMSRCYLDYSWKARGTGWAKDVSDDQWKQFYDRRRKAEAILDDVSGPAGQTLYGHYLRAEINAPDQDTFAITRGAIAYLNEHAPLFLDPYEVMANYLLPRWGGQPGELEQYAKTSANHLGGEDGDMLYADLLTFAAYMDEKEFVQSHHPDVPRMVRGCEALLRADKAHVPYRRARYAWALGMIGDWPACRQQLILAGPVYGNFEPWWNRRRSYMELLQKSGLYEKILDAEMLEKKGSFDEAEAAFLALDPDRKTNLWLTDFYLRNGEAAKFEASPGAPDLSQAPDKLPPMTVYDDMVTFGALRDFKRGLPYALRYDSIRGWNVTGKLFLYEKALFEGDKAAADKARHVIVAWKTSRKSYQIGQAMLADGADVASFSPVSLDWSDPYASQGAVMMALRFYELGMTQNARQLLQTAITVNDYRLDVEYMQSLLLHPPAPLQDKAAAKPAEKAAAGAASGTNAGAQGSHP